MRPRRSYFYFLNWTDHNAVIDIREIGRASPSRCPGKVEASRLQDTPSLRPFSAEETLLTALCTLTREVAIFWDSSLTWENFTRTNTVSCPAAGNHRTKCLLQLNPPLALIIFFKEKPLTCSHLCFKYKKCNFHQIHVPPLMASTSELERRSKSLGTCQLFLNIDHVPGAIDLSYLCYSRQSEGEWWQQGVQW